MPYKITQKNKNMLKRYKKGISIGFTGKASLRAKGLLPRESKKYKGRYVLGPKYSNTGKNQVIKHNLKIYGENVKTEKKD